MKNFKILLSFLVVSSLSIASADVAPQVAGSNNGILATLKSYTINPISHAFNSVDAYVARALSSCASSVTSTTSSVVTSVTSTTNSVVTSVSQQSKNCFTALANHPVTAIAVVGAVVVAAYVAYDQANQPVKTK